MVEADVDVELKLITGGVVATLLAWHLLGLWFKIIAIASLLGAGYLWLHGGSPW